MLSVLRFRNDNCRQLPHDPAPFAHNHLVQTRRLFGDQRPPELGERDGISIVLPLRGPLWMLKKLIDGPGNAQRIIRIDG